MVAKAEWARWAVVDLRRGMLITFFVDIDNREHIDVTISSGYEHPISSWRLTMLRIIAVVILLLPLVGGCTWQANSASQRVTINPFDSEQVIRPADH
jgi:hypothetical protein